jgi:hypothetical protein
LQRANLLQGRAGIRVLQPYLVGLRRKLADDARKLGLLRPINGYDLVEEWCGTYDSVLGLQFGGSDVYW